MANKVKFTDNSRQAKAAIDEQMKTGLEAGLMIIQAQAKALAPVDSGELRDSIGYDISQTNNGYLGRIGSPLMHAIYVEYGTGELAKNGAGRKGGWRYKDTAGKWHFTRGMAAQPFLLPAFRRTKKNVELTIGAKLRKVGGK